MYIVGKHKDYYEVFPNNKDDRPLYVRSSEEISLRETGDPLLKEEFERKRLFKAAALKLMSQFCSGLPIFNRNNRRFRSDKLGVIIFCGKAYPLYWVEGSACYDVEQVIKSVEEFTKLSDSYIFGGKAEDKKALALLKSDKLEKHREWSFVRATKDPFTMALTRKGWAEYLKQRPERSVDPSIHLLFNAPVIYVSSEEIIINPLLSAYNFASQIDPYTAYQELDMFIGNTLTVRETPDLNMTEALKVNSKGMDKWSFRTHPSFTKKPRKRNK